MSDKKEWKGITINDFTLLGKVVDDPQFVGGEGNVWAMFKIKTYVREPSANGQWNDVAIDVPVICNDQKKVAALQKFVQAGRELKIDGYYKSWVDNAGVTQHGIMVRTFDLGSKPYEPKSDTPDIPR
jgi:hypothetical protein